MLLLSSLLRFAFVAGFMHSYMESTADPRVPSSSDAHSGVYPPPASATAAAPHPTARGSDCPLDPWLKLKGKERALVAILRELHDTRRKVALGLYPWNAGARREPISDIDLEVSLNCARSIPRSVERKRMLWTLVEDAYRRNREFAARLLVVVGLAAVPTAERDRAFDARSLMRGEVKRRAASLLTAWRSRSLDVRSKRASSASGTVTARRSTNE